MSSAHFSATRARDEAVLRFPYDERLRLLLRAIPGRRWDPLERAWCIPLEPDQSEALARLFSSLPSEPDVDRILLRAIERLRRRRSHGECVVDLARPDENWWLGFATDAAPDSVAALLKHPEAHELPTIGRALVPLDDRAARLIERLLAPNGGIRLTDAARRALGAQAERGAGEAPPSEPGRSDGHGPDERYDVSFRRDRRGAHWILVAAERAALARVLAAQTGLRALDGPAGTLGLSAVEHDADLVIELLDHLEEVSVDPRVSSWLERATTWRGHVEVDGSGEQPCFVLLGDVARLPRAIRELAQSAPGGATLPLTHESWRLIDGRLEGWMSASARRCVTALREGRPPPPAVLELSSVHEEPTFVLAAGHEPSLLAQFAALEGALARDTPRRPGGLEHSRLPAMRADPFCVPSLDRFLAAHEVWVDPATLPILQEIREQHARAAGLVSLSAATDAALRVRGLGGELKPFQRAGVAYLLSQRRAFLSDEQGLGKTIEAIATLEADDAYPAVVVCPASLKLNWLRELERWIPGRSAQALAGGGSGAAIPDAAVTVVNYEIVGPRLEGLRGLGPRALVLDESHYCKNAAAKRTRAVQRLAAAVPRDGLILALTGTPVLNRPAELISQLRILDRLGDFGSGVQFGKRFRGADAPAQGGRPAPAAREDPRDRAGRARQRVRVQARRARCRRVAPKPAARPAGAGREGCRRAASRAARAVERPEAARSPGKAPRRPRLDPRFLRLGREARRLRPPPGDPARRARALSGGAAHSRRGQPRRKGSRAARIPSARQGRKPAARVLGRGRRSGPHADAILQRGLPRARLDPGQARPGRGPLPPHRPGGCGQRVIPARRGNDRRDDLDTARAQARRDRRGDRRTRRGRGGRRRRARSRVAPGALQASPSRRMSTVGRRAQRPKGARRACS
ncbi:MAG: hypothetical protein E6G62_09700 [Actinobacteria bacterium]|nr:MAG: hypothetical protein E6G62_09700 [Actinomycetota bacterium]